MYVMICHAALCLTHILRLVTKYRNYRSDAFFALLGNAYGKSKPKPCGNYKIQFAATDWRASLQKPHNPALKLAFQAAGLKTSGFFIAISKSIPPFIYAGIPT